MTNNKKFKCGILIILAIECIIMIFWYPILLIPSLIIAIAFAMLSGGE